MTLALRIQLATTQAELGNAWGAGRRLRLFFSVLSNIYGWSEGESTGPGRASSDAGENCHISRASS